jgi:hypothetical protein
LHSIRAYQYENSAYIEIRHYVWEIRSTLLPEISSQRQRAARCKSPRSVRRAERMEACAECDLETEYTLLDEIKVVNSIRVDLVTEKASTNQPSGRSTGRVVCTLWCSALHPRGDLSQPSCKTNQGSRPDIAHAMQAVRQKVMENHSGAACAEAAAAARLDADGPRTRPPSDALSAMMADPSSRCRRPLG